MKIDNWKAVALVVFIGAVIGLFFMFNRGLYIDEYDHYQQIFMFLSGNYQVYYTLPVLPVYHFVLAVFGNIFNADSYGFFRFINLLFGMLSVFVSYKILKEIKAGDVGRRTLLYFFLPIVFPYFFLIYTDIFSLLFVLLAVLFLVRKNYFAAQIFAVVAMFTRQNNVIWLGFVLAWMFFEDRKYVRDIDWSFTKKIIPSIIGGILFFYVFFVKNVLFVAAKNVHPVGVYAGNVFFLLLLSFILFVPMHWNNRHKVIEYLRRKRQVWLVLILAFFAYLYTFNIEHIYNVARPMFLRNQILMFIVSSIWIKAVFFVPLAYSAISLALTPMADKRAYLIYICAALFLLPSQLVEQRYSIIPISLLVLFMDEPKKEYWTVGWFALLSFAIIIGISKGLLYF